MIKVLFFAQLQDALGSDSIKIEEDSLSVYDLKQQLKNDYPTLQLDGVMVAVNEEYALDEDIISSGDIVAFIPPVSGG
ncbi:molybdopterin converting factor subunit 1 [Ornithinibacillus halophilus]|uniref:Molybdopterin synthase sulfur carrier subunit n=1 Tax=Ornithinibacillus halophilus TaxID=930117 RepID=A0A1M5FK21_9BACI|nr:molybdopterin converting factor subunit 1 [Ornithinibacillus halophilus]SHF91870.1 molybdopterin synthase sulfur carrier subunit [Ornithinibacillus halophilus]